MSTVTRADLAELINQQIGLSRLDSAMVVDRIIDHVCTALVNGEDVKVSGFGSFILRDKAERIGRNPKTGVEVPIAARRVLSFRPSKSLRARVSGV